MAHTELYKQDLPVKPTGNQPWTATPLFPLKAMANAVGALLKETDSFDILTVLFTVCIFTLELLERSSWAFYGFAIVVLGAALAGRYLKIKKKEPEK